MSTVQQPGGPVADLHRSAAGTLGYPVSRAETSTALLSWISSWVGIAIVTIVAAALRFTNLSSTGFEIDEGFTLTYARQSWTGVLGFHGFYSPHPPLFYTLAKLANVFVPEMVASRTVAAIAGTATIPVFYALCARLVDRRVALGAAALLTVAPLHVEYSRIGRMYAPVVFLTALSFLALIAFWQSGKRTWLGIYSLALVLAVYVDYSAAYALAPQAILLAVMFRANRQRAIRLLGAAAVAMLAYLPWLPQIAHTIDRSSNAKGRDDYLAASWENLQDSLVLLAGLTGRGSWSGAPHPAAWHRWPELHTLLMLGLIPVAVVGAVALRRNGVSLLLTILLVVGTPLTSIVASLVSPGFAARTVMIAILGWALLASAFLIGKTLPIVLRIVGGISWCFVFAVSALAVPVSYNDGRTSDWPPIVDDLSAYAYLGKPILIFSTAGMLTDMIDLYDGNRLDGARFVSLLDGERETWTGAERWLSRGFTIAQMQTGALDRILPPEDPSSDAFWFIRRFGGNEAAELLTTRGYRQIGEVRYRDTNLELWARPGAVLGTPVDIGRGFDDNARWRLSPSAEIGSGTSTAGPPLSLTEDRARAATSVNGEAGLFTLEVQIAQTGASSGRATVKCISAGGDELAKRTAPATDGVASGEWIDLSVAVLCPEGTATVRIVLDRRGSETVTFSAPRLQLAQPEPR